MGITSRETASGLPGLSSPEIAEGGRRAQSFILPVPPTPKARPRIVRLKNGASHAFNSDKTVCAEERIRWHLRSQNARLWPSGVGLAVSVTFFCKRPKTLPKKVTHNTKRPDLDQYVKLLFDAGNSLLWSDDSQITSLSADKAYTTDEPYIYLVVSEDSE